MRKGKKIIENVMDWDLMEGGTHILREYQAENNFKRAIADKVSLES